MTSCKCKHDRHKRNARIRHLSKKFVGKKVVITFRNGHRISGTIVVVGQTSLVLSFWVKGCKERAKTPFSVIRNISLKYKDHHHKDHHHKHHEHNCTHHEHHEHHHCPNSEQEQERKPHPGILPGHCFF